MSTLSSVLPASEARNNLYTILDEVSNKFRRFTITLRGKAKVVIMSAEEVESWEETLEIMSDKKLVNQINEGINDIKHGRVISQEQLLKNLNLTEKDLAVK